MSLLSNFDFDKSQLSEHELQDDYPVYWDYIYIINGDIIVSEVQGTVRDLKRQYLQDNPDVEEITVTSFDKWGRYVQLKAAGQIKD
jgi:hypothetical protein